MLLYINDKEEHIQPENLYLNSMLRCLHINSEKGIAIAVNGIIISRSTWANYVINEHDKITLIQATQGG